MGLGGSLFKARKKSGLSQEAVAEKLGVSRQTISKWELDETLPDICQSKKLAVLYGLSLDELIDFNVEQKEIEAIIEKTETDDNITVLRFLVQRYSHFIIMVADLFHLTPHRFPCFVECRRLGIGQSKSVHQSRIILQFQTQL